MGKLKFKIACVFILSIYLFSSLTVPVFASTTYFYDTNGNMNSDGTNCYTYNDANQVSQVKNCSTGKIIAQYVYDYQGNRIVKKGYDTNGNLQQTTYTPTKSYEAKKIVSGNVTQNTVYYFINDQVVARKNSDTTKNYYLPDNLGSTNLLTDQNGNVVENTTYYPFGDIRSGATKSEQLYTGQINDPETGLDYYNARYYNAHTRRFTQPDDVIANIYNPQDLNRYSYVNNNPLTYNDPSGHCIFDPIEFAACAAIAMPVIAELSAMTPNETAFLAMNSSDTYNDFRNSKDNNRFLTLTALPMEVTGGGKAAITAFEAAGAFRNAEGASNAVNGLKLSKSLASQQQLGEMERGGEIIAGEGSNPYKIHKDATKIANENGGRPEDWVKKSSSYFRASDGMKTAIHWVENIKSGFRVLQKTVMQIDIAKKR